MSGTTPGLVALPAGQAQSEAVGLAGMAGSRHLTSSRVDFHVLLSGVGHYHAWPGLRRRGRGLRHQRTSQSQSGYRLAPNTGPRGSILTWTFHCDLSRRGMASLISALVTSVYCCRASCWVAESPLRSKSPSLAIMYRGPLRPCTLLESDNRDAHRL